MARRIRRAGSPWRVLAHDWVTGGRGYSGRHELGSEQHPSSEFDELVVGKWLHVEQLDTGSWYLHVGGVAVHVKADRDGRARYVGVAGPGQWLPAVPGCEYTVDWPVGPTNPGGGA